MFAALNLAKNHSSVSSSYLLFVVLLSDGVSTSEVTDGLLQELANNNQKVITIRISTGIREEIASMRGENYLYEYIFSTTDNDGDGLPDLDEISGMRDQYGKIWRTNPNKHNTDTNSTIKIIFFFISITHFILKLL